MENLKPVLEFIINNFNQDCAEELYRERAAVKNGAGKRANDQYQ
jgi:hypothetical protein